MHNVRVFLAASFTALTQFCVYWNTTNLKWQSDGCEALLRVEDDASRSVSSVLCECSHLTDFTIDCACVDVSCTCWRAFDFANFVCGLCALRSECPWPRHLHVDIVSLPVNCFRGLLELCVLT